ncbi:MAG: acetylxylan esterase [Verrucomicrobia bacterium]|nr:acetylxylan esterase [Verrucomicrobiota bacterium]
MHFFQTIMKNLQRNSVRVISPVLALAMTAGTMSGADEPEPTRTLRELNKSYFPFTPVSNAAEWKARREEIKRRVLVASGLYPMPAKTPLNAVIHSRIEKDDYTVDKVMFESLPGHFVTGNLYLPRNIKGKIPAIVSPHGHWPDGRFMHESDAEVKKQIESGAEKFQNAAHSHMQARCVQLARMGCAVFLYDMLGYADSVQFKEHRHGPAAKGFVSTEAELNLVSYFGLQTWNSERVVDFMCSLPFVDRARIGCTGESGGGTQTMMITGIDDRIAAAFPCVMVSTAMQGGCTCENAHYLRINQGNIDIAAITAPRPLGMTAADDWTKELEAKGFPDLKNLYSMLGIPDRVEAHFNIQFPHNYNGVSRAQMYAFFNRHLKLGLANTDERDFQLLSTPELSVWNGSHPKPTGDKVGETHEIAVVDWFKQQASGQIDPLLHPKSKADLRRAREVLGGALEVMIGRTLPKSGAASFNLRTQEDKDGFLIQRGSTTCNGDTIETTFLYPKKWNHDVVLWLSLKGEDSILKPDGNPGESAAQMLKRGYAIACPRLYLRGATRNPNVYAADKRKSGGAYEGFAGYHYGYNPSIFAERVRDALTLIAEIRDDNKHSARRILVAGVEGAGVIAATATAMSPGTVHQLGCDTGGFRFAQLDNAWDVNFLPGAAKYGDVPAILSLCSPVKTTLIGETRGSVTGVASAFAVAKVQVEFAGASKSNPVNAVVNALTGHK